MYVPYNKGCVTTNDIPFKRGIFQGNSLSPLLFCLELTPLTHMLSRAEVIYRLNGKTVSHVPYVDNFKVFARKPKEMVKCKEIIERFSKDICMDFGIDICAVVFTKGGVIFESPCVTGIPLLLGEDNYKYLSILECDKILLKEVKEYLQ